MNLLRRGSSYAAPGGWLLAFGLVLFTMVVLPAVAGAATLNATHGPTLTGTSPFDASPGPGNDVDQLDDVVRTNDYVTYTWAISVNDGSSPDTTITQTLPAGIEWEAPLPAFCLTTGVTPPSSISSDGSTIVCNLGDKDSSTGSADQYPVVAKVRGDIPHGTVLSTNFTVSSSDPGTPDATPASPVVTNVSAAPRVNLVKSAPNPSQSLGYNGGVWGQFVTYPVSLVVDSVDGKGSKGNELLVTPITFEDAFVLTPGGVGFELIGCGANSGHISGIPNGNGGSANSTTFSGAPSCSQSAPGGDISFTVPTDADLSGGHVPTNTSGGGTTPANRAYLATYYIRVFVPNTDIVAVGGAVNIANTYENFDAESISGAANVDPPEDNVQAIDLVATDPQPGTTSIAKAFGPSGGGTWNSVNQHIYPEDTFWARLSLSTGGHLPIPAGTVATCDMFDNTSFHLTLEGSVGGGDPTQPAWLTGSAAGTPPNAVIEYGTGGVRGHDPDGWGTGGSPPGARDDDCADASSPTGWTTDAGSVPGGLEAITKIRVRYLEEFPGGAGTVSTLNMNFKVRNVGLGETDPMPSGTILANFGKISRNQGSGTPTWSSNSYNPATAGGSVGRRLLLTRGDVRLQKDTDPPGQTIALSGDTFTYRLNVTATGEHIPGGIMTDVVVRDTLDEYQTYVVGSASPAPTEVIDNGDGTTTLVWELGDRPVNEAIPDITYDARIALNTPNNRDVINRAIVSSPDDASADNVRSDQHQIRVTQKAGILIEKSTSTPWVEPHDQLEFQVNYVNNSVTALNGLESIDVLPWNGDSRGSDFNGSVSLASVTVHDGQEVYYTSEPPAGVSDNPRDPSNGPGGSTEWCLEAQFGTVGCPAAVGDSTAIRVVDTGLVPRFASFIYDIVLNTEGNHSGDVYGNRAGLATPDDAVLLAAFSPPVVDRVVASALGDYVWIDSNRNGIQDPGEPPVAGVAVNLTGTDKHGRAVNLTTTTDASGRYLFPHLVSGQYEIEFVAPDGYAFTIRGAGSDPTVDSNADPATGRTGPITIDSPIPLQADQEDMTWDAGLVALPGTITIIKDARPNADVNFGFDTTGGLPRASFQLMDDGQGTEDRITFGDLDAGTYGVTERSRNGWRLSNVQCSGTATSTVNGATVSIELGPGQEATCTYVNQRVRPPGTRPNPKPRLVLRKKADRRTVRQGNVVNYRIGFRNVVRGSVARNVLICDNIPRWTSVAHRGGGFFRNGQVCWRIKRLAFSRSLKTRKLRLRIDRDAPAGRRIVNRVRTGRVTASDSVRVTRDRSAVSRAGGVTG